MKNKEVDPPTGLPDSAQMLEFVLAKGLPMHRDGQHRYHGVSEPIWWATQIEAIRAAMLDFRAQSLAHLVREAR